MNYLSLWDSSLTTEAVVPDVAVLNQIAPSGVSFLPERIRVVPPGKTLPVPRLTHEAPEMVPVKLFVLLSPIVDEAVCNRPSSIR